MIRKVSVIIPIYKGNSFIRNLINMLEENWKTVNEIEAVSMELILVNDYPIEKMEVERQWLNNISCVEIENKQNSGIHFSRVQGLLHSSGEYVLFLDQDDTISPVYMREQLLALENNDAIICNGKNRSDLIYGNLEELNRAVEKEGYREGANRIVSPGQVLLKKSAIPEEWVSNILARNGADDYFLWLLMFSKNRKIKIQNKVLYWHLISDVNASKNRDEMDRSVLEMASIARKLGFLSLEEEKQIEKSRNQMKKAEIISEEKYWKEKVYKQILERWMTLRDRKITVDLFLERRGIKTIAIYGAGIFGRHLYYELKDTNITIACFLDQNRIMDIPEIKTIVPGEPVEDIDAIVITPIMEYEEIRSSLEQKYDFNMLSLETVIYNADYELMMG